MIKGIEMLALRNLRVGSRLGAGFGLLLLFIVAIVGLALYGNHLKSAQFEKVVDVNMVKMRLLNDMLDTNNAVLMHRRLMVIKRGEDFDRDYQKAQELSQTDGIWARYIRIPRDATGDTLVAKIDAARKATDASTRHLHERMKAGDFDGAAKELLAEQGLATAWNEAIWTLLRHQGDTDRAQPRGIPFNRILDRHAVDRVRRVEPGTGLAGRVGHHPQPDPPAGRRGEAGRRHRQWAAGQQH